MTLRRPLWVAGNLTELANGDDLIGSVETIPFHRYGSGGPGTDLATFTGTLRLPIVGSFTILSVAVAVAVAPTGAALIVDVLKNGTSLWATTTANRPTIAVSTNQGVAGAPDTPTLTTGDYLTVDIDQVGSTVKGQDLAGLIRMVRTG